MIRFDEGMPPAGKNDKNEIGPGSVWQRYRRVRGLVYRCPP